jgi:hypothetical protein
MLRERGLMTLVSKTGDHSNQWSTSPEFNELAEEPCLREMHGPSILSLVMAVKGGMK